MFRRKKKEAIKEASAPTFEQAMLSLEQLEARMKEYAAQEEKLQRDVTLLAACEEGLKTEIVRYRQVSLSPDEPSWPFHEAIKDT